MKIGFVASCFDLLHAGHLAMLRECEEVCSGPNDVLIVGLHVNPKLERPEKNKPIESLPERWMKLYSMLGKTHFRIVPYETEEDLIKILKLYKPTVRFLGSDYKHKKYTGDELKIPIYWIDRSHGISSSLLRAKIMATPIQKEIDRLLQNIKNNKKVFDAQSVFLKDPLCDDPSIAYQTPPKEELKFKYTPPKKHNKAKKK